MKLTIGQTAVCAETGLAFVVARDGCSVNYATDAHGRIFSDTGVDIRERRELLDRTKPFCCYVSSDGKLVTGWKGNTLGTIVSSGSYRGGWHGSRIYCYTVRDIHGGYWHGKNGGEGMRITLRASNV